MTAVCQAAVGNPLVEVLRFIEMTTLLLKAYLVCIALTATILLLEALQPAFIPARLDGCSLAIAGLTTRPLELAGDRVLCSADRRGSG